MPMLHKFSALMMLVAVVAGCKLRGSSEPEIFESQPQALIDCHASKGFESGFNVCIDDDGVSPAAVARVKEYLDRGIVQWLRPLRAQYPKISSELRFQCDDANLTVFLLGDQQQGIGGCGVVQVPTSMAEADFSKPDFKLQAEILHLIGIAIGGLKPTYESYGECLADQQPSIMCFASNTTKIDDSGSPSLFAEDEKLILEQYQAL